MTLENGGFGCWSPDGRKLAVAAEIAPDNRGRIWIVDPFENGGGVPGKLTNNNREEHSIDWRDPALFHVAVDPLSKSSITTWGYIKNEK